MISILSACTYILYVEATTEIKQNVVPTIKLLLPQLHSLAPHPPPPPLPAAQDLLQVLETLIPVKRYVITCHLFANIFIFLTGLAVTLLC